MTRISLKEAYDNRDVIAWLAKHEDEINEMMNILKNINPDGDLTNIVLKTGDQTIDGTKTFIGKIVANCDIIQNGAAYETHAEQIFSQNDYLVMRDGQLSALAAGSYSGLQIKKYNGSDDCRMVVDNTGTMRVGDINDERPLAVRDEAANLTSGALVKWDGVNQQMITSSANVGDDTHPVKIVDGAPVAVSASLGVTNTLDYGSGSGTCPAASRLELVTKTVSETGTYLLNGYVQVNDIGTPGAETYAIGFKINSSYTEYYTGSFWTASYSRSTITVLASLQAGDTVSIFIGTTTNAHPAEGTMAVVRIN